MNTKRRWRELTKELGERKITMANIALNEKEVGLDEFFKENEVSLKEAVILRQYARAVVTGDVRSAEFLRDTSGEKPTTELSVQEHRSPLSELSLDELKLLIKHFKEEQDELLERESLSDEHD